MFLWVLDDDEKWSTGQTRSFSPTSTKAEVSLFPFVCMTGQLLLFWFQRPLARSCLLRGERYQEKSLCLSIFSIADNPFFDFLLPSVTSKCQPAWETPGDPWSAERKPLKTYTIKFFLPFTMMNYWKARWHFAIMRCVQQWSLVRWNVIYKYLMSGIYWCFAAAFASSGIHLWGDTHHNKAMKRYYSHPFNCALFSPGNVEIYKTPLPVLMRNDQLRIFTRRKLEIAFTLAMLQELNSRPSWVS